MNKSLTITLVVVLLLYGCSNPEESAPSQPLTQNASINQAVDSIKKEVKDTAEVAKTKLADEAGAEIERIYQELLEVADNFSQNADALESEAKAEFDNVLAEFDQKKQAFADKLAQFKSSTADTRDGMLKDLYEALTDLKSTLDRATQSFKQTESADAPAETPA